MFNALQKHKEAEIPFKGCMETDNSNKEETEIIILRLTEVLENIDHQDLETVNFCGQKMHFLVPNIYIY